MSNTRQPAVKRAPATQRSKAAKKKAQDDLRKSIRIDGVVYTVDPLGITGSRERVVMAEIGKTVVQFIDELDTSPGVYTLGVFMWIAQLSEAAKGSEPKLDDVLDSISYGSDVEVVTEAAKPPEA